MKGRIDVWVGGALVVLGFGAVVVAGLVTLTRSRNQPLHPDSSQVHAHETPATVARLAPAVARTRQAALDALKAQNLPGVSVAVGRGDAVLFAGGYGWADVDRKDEVTPQTRFRIGHVSKALTSAVVGRLRDQGRMHVDEEIQVYVPAYPRQTWPVTVRQLMGHVAGVRHYQDDEWGDKPTQHCGRASAGLALVPAGLLFEPGTRSSYSTYGWVLVSAAVENAAGHSFVDAARTLVFDPLGMSDTVADAPTQRMANRATSYYRGNLGGTLTTDVDYSCFAGGGAFLSTPTDLVRFGLALMGGEFLRPATIALLQAPQTLASGETTSFGLGWMLDTVELAGARTPVIGHASRTLEGASTSFLTFPEHDLVVAVSTNMSFADMRSVALAIAAAFVAQTS